MARRGKAEGGREGWPGLRCGGRCTDWAGWIPGVTAPTYNISNAHISSLLPFPSVPDANTPPSLCTQKAKFTKLVPQTALLCKQRHRHPLKRQPGNQASPRPISPHLHSVHLFLHLSRSSSSPHLLKAPSSTSGPPQGFPATLPAEMLLGASTGHTPSPLLHVTAIAGRGHYVKRYTDKETEAQRAWETRHGHTTAL